MAIVKKGVLCFICSAVAAVLWLLITNLLDFEISNVDFATFVVFVAMSTSISAVIAKEYLNKKKSIFWKIGYLALMNLFSIVVMYGVLFLTIFLLLSQH